MTRRKTHSSATGRGHIGYSNATFLIDAGFFYCNDSVQLELVFCRRKKRLDHSTVSVWSRHHDDTAQARAASPPQKPIQPLYGYQLAKAGGEEGQGCGPPVDPGASSRREGGRLHHRTVGRPRHRGMLSAQRFISDLSTHKSRLIPFILCRNVGKNEGKVFHILRKLLPFSSSAFTILTFVTPPTTVALTALVFRSFMPTTAALPTGPCPASSRYS